MGRKDGKLVKTDAMFKVMPHIMNNRCDAEVYIQEKIDITNILEFINKYNKGKEKKDEITLFHTLSFSLAKTIYHRPHLNRFIAGRKLYQRNKITLCFTAKNKFTDEANESLIIFDCAKDKTIFDLRDSIVSKVTEARKENNNTDKLMNAVTNGPRFLVMFIIKVLKWMEFLGITPKSIMEIDPYHTSAMLSNLGSIKCNQIYHHLNNYGTNSMMMTIGTMYKEGNKTFVDVGVTADERICDGFYFAKSILLFKSIMQDSKNLTNMLEEDIIKKED